MRKALVPLVLLLLTFPASFVVSEAAQTSTQESRADQLDELFAKLRDPLGAGVEPQIWTLWLLGGTDEQNAKLAKAAMLMNVQAFDECERQLTELLKTSPNFPEVWNKRATVYYLLGRMDESLADIEKTLDLEPRHFGALSGRGMIYQRMGKNAEALKAYKEALKIHPHLTGASFTVKQLEKLVPEL